MPGDLRRRAAQPVPVCDGSECHRDLLRINDVGQNVWEEIDQGVKGADYGWNVREGHCPNTGQEANCAAPNPTQFTNPIHDYAHSTGCASITGGAFVPNGVWPASYTGGYLFSDYVCGKIFLLSSGARTEFAINLGGSSAVHLEFGPHAGSQALYYTTYANGGEVRRIAYSAAVNRPPTAVISANPTSGPAPLTVTLNGSGSSDPDGNPLTYLWSFGDGSPDATTSSPTVQHSYPAGSWTATLRVRDEPAGATSAPVTVAINSGNTAADRDHHLTERQRIVHGRSVVHVASHRVGSAGWSAPRLGHELADHPAARLAHPPVPGTGERQRHRFHRTGPEDLQAAATSDLQIQLTVVDSGGASTTVVRDFSPRKVNVTIATTPAGRTVLVNGTPLTGPTTVTSWAGFDLQLAAGNHTDTAGRTYVLDGWSDGGAATHTFKTPSSPATVTANFSLRGLQGAYFDGPNHSGTRIERLDATIPFDWGSGPPIAGIGPDTFSVRWRGQIAPRHSQTYTFATTSDDGIRLWVNNVLLIDQWNDHAPTVHSATIALAANVRYPIVMEHYENGGGAVAQLRWSSASQPLEIVPADRLYPSYAFNFQPAAAPVPAGYVPDSGAVFGTGLGFQFGWNAVTPETRDRNAASSPDQRYDTLIHLQKPSNPNASWELVIPNGTYRVRMVAGDPSYFDGTFSINAEGVPVVTGAPTSAQRWVEGTADVVVNDGGLTVTNRNGSVNNKLNFVEVSLR